MSKRLIQETYEVEFDDFKIIDTDVFGNPTEVWLYAKGVHHTTIFLSYDAVTGQLAEISTVKA